MTARRTKSADSAPVGHGNKERLRSKAIAALISAPTVEKAARMTGVSKETLYRWMGDQDFAAELSSARRALVTEAISRLQAMLADAIATLHRLLTSKAPTVQLGSARAIVEYAFRARELFDVEERLAELEQRLANSGGK